MKAEYRAQAFPILSDFLGYLEIVKGRASGTVDEYFIDLRAFFRFLKKKKLSSFKDVELNEIPIDDIDISLIKGVKLLDVYEYLGYLKNECGNGSAALARKSCSMRMFFKYLTNNTKQLETNPIETLETPKIKKALPKYLTLEQSIELLEKPEGKFAERDYCMIVLLLNCGLRRAELASLNIGDIKSDNTLIVTGKGNKERLLYLNEACLDALARYLPTRPIDGVEKKHRKALFYSARRTRITVDGIHFIIKKYLGDVDGAENFSTHKLRHTAATLMYRNGTDVRVLQDILGHESLSTTQIYTHTSSKQIKNAIEDNPLSKIKAKPKKKIKTPEEETEP